MRRWASRPPASCWIPRRDPIRASRRTLYDADHAERRVRSDGGIKWAGEFSLRQRGAAGRAGRYRRAAIGDWLVRFADLELGLIDRQTGS